MVCGLPFHPSPFFEWRKKQCFANISPMRVGSLSSLEQRDCAACAVKICSQKDFKGQCYWGCYAPDKLIELDEYWYTHTASVGVAKGCTCTTGNP